MNIKDKKWKRRTPEVEDVCEFLEIARDYIDPKDAIREAISNAIDWGAKEIEVVIEEDKSRPDEELIIKIKDDGIGLDKDRLEAFFDLGRSTASEQSKLGRKIGYKGHGTKTYFNSRQIDVFSESSDYTVYAIMDLPIQNLMNNKVPEYQYDIQMQKNKKTRTEITICGYNMNQNRGSFAHIVLKDYILWFTLFGSVEKEFGVKKNMDKILKLQGLGQEQPEIIEFGHKFPKMNNDIKKLKGTHPGEWTKFYVNGWVFRGQPIISNPSKKIDIVFYIEGDEAKRSYNPMIRVSGKPEYGYKVEDRYGLWVSKDYIPVKRYNEWLGLGKRLETKYHAFVNCQEFRLQANRGDIGNTPADLLHAIEQTVRQVFEKEIQGSADYQEYDENAELEQQYQTAKQEGKDFQRRMKRAKTKKIYEFMGIEVLEPGIEMGVVSLFNQIYALKPELFPFRVIDYDTKKGYDALVSRGSPIDLSKETVFFVEFKFMLTKEFNHSFDHLCAIICWDCNLPDGEEIRDLENKQRKLHITSPGDETDYTRYMLISSVELHNIEVFVLKEYLHEKLGVEFHHRSKKT